MFLTRNPSFFYPIGAQPGVDWDNPAVVNGQLRFSGVASQGNSTTSASTPSGFTQIYPTFQRGTTNASNSVVMGYKIDGLLGPVNTGVLSANSSIEFPGNTTANDLSYVIAAIFRTGSTVASLQYIFSTGNSGTVNSNVVIELTGAGVIEVGTFFATLVSSGVTATVNTPYFVAASIKTSQWRIVVVNLQTGTTRITNATPAVTLAAPSGTVSVLGLTGNTIGFGGSLAACMFSNCFAGFPQLLSWARDPWKFWYPQRAARYRVKKTSSSSTLAALAVPRTIFLPPKRKFYM